MGKVLNLVLAFVGWTLLYTGAPFVAILSLFNIVGDNYRVNEPGKINALVWSVRFGFIVWTTLIILILLWVF